MLIVPESKRIRQEVKKAETDAAKVRKRGQKQTKQSSAGSVDREFLHQLSSSVQVFPVLHDS